jgi:hypothetical protein
LKESRRRRIGDAGLSGLVEKVRRISVQAGSSKFQTRIALKSIYMKICAREVIFL